MKIQTVNVMVGYRNTPSDQDFKTAIYRTGPDVVPVSEIPVYQAMHGMDCVSHISPAGEIETRKEDEFQRIRAKFPKTYQLAYPSAAVPMPKTIEELDVEPSQIDPNPPKRVEELTDVSGPIARGMTAAIELQNMPQDKDVLLARLKELKVNPPFGGKNLGVPKLQAMLLDAERAAAAKAA